MLYRECDVNAEMNIARTVYICISCELCVNQALNYVLDPL